VSARIFSIAVLLSVCIAGGTWAQDALEPGAYVEIQFDNLPAPAPGTGVRNSPETVARSENDGLRVPPGFTANLFAEGLAHPRWMTVAPNGDVLLAETREGRITILRDEDGDGVADVIETFASGYQRPHGLAIRNGYLYVADLQAVWRVPYVVGALSARGREPVTSQGALGSASGHWTRNIAFSADGEHIYVAIGSRGNLGEEAEPRATVQRFLADGTEQITFGGGLRNPVGIAVHPRSGELYVVVNERDGYGDDLVPDYLTRVQEGEFFGWPYAYLGPHPDPEWGDVRPDLVEATLEPDVLFQAHSAPVGLLFYDADQFPARYHEGAFVSHRGSWNSSRPTGYRLVFVPFADDRPIGGYEVFADGFRRGGEERAQVWGRPTGLAVLNDGSLLVADDTGGTVWRISYTGD